ncbi:MAG: hypothetical protein IID40_10305 [Planctomycetes bacterium]|nr:hypothetical protein [Planctomycetota bacterium]
MNVRGLCCALADRYGWPPDVVGDMTVAQAEMYLTGGGGGDGDGDGETGKPRTIWFDSPAEANAWRTKRGFI